VASITVCDKCGAKQSANQRNWYTLTFVDNNRNPAEPVFGYDLCLDCAQHVAAQQDWIFL
jgi:hypothetical protein